MAYRQVPGSQILSRMCASLLCCNIPSKLIDGLCRMRFMPLTRVPLLVLHSRGTVVDLILCHKVFGSHSWTSLRYPQHPTQGLAAAATSFLAKRMNGDAFQVCTVAGGLASKAWRSHLGPSPLSLLRSLSSCASSSLSSSLPPASSGNIVTHSYSCCSCRSISSALCTLAFPLSWTTSPAFPLG